MERELEHLLKQKDEQAGLCSTNPRTLLSPMTWRISRSPCFLIRVAQLRAIESKLAASERSRQNATRRSL